MVVACLLACLLVVVVLVAVKGRKESSTRTNERERERCRVGSESVRDEKLLFRATMSQGCEEILV